MRHLHQLQFHLPGFYKVVGSSLQDMYLCFSPNAVCTTVGNSMHIMSGLGVVHLLSLISMQKIASLLSLLILMQMYLEDLCW